MTEHYKEQEPCKVSEYDKDHIWYKGRQYVSLRRFLEVQEPCTDAQERYEDLCEYFGDAKDILKSRKDFKAWLERIKWHIHKAEELYEKYEHKQEPCENCDYSEIVDWEQDAKTGKAKPIYWCERHKEPCDDVVSRQAALDCATLITSIPTEDWDIGDWVCLFRDRLSQLPSARPQEPKTGEWIAVENEEMEIIGYYCSKCDLPMETEEQTDYCPNCGARMVEPQESEDKE